MHLKIVVSLLIIGRKIRASIGVGSVHQRSKDTIMLLSQHKPTLGKVLLRLLFDIFPGPVSQAESATKSAFNSGCKFRLNINCRPHGPYRVQEYS